MRHAREPSAVIFGELVRRERKGSSMSQEELAHESGLNKTYLGEIERGEKVVSIVTIVKIAQAFKMTPGDFLSKADFGKIEINS